MFSNHISEMKDLNQPVNVMAKDNLVLIKIVSDKNTFYIGFINHDLIAQGSFAHFIKGFLVNPDGTLDETHPVGIKKILSHYKDNEYKTLLDLESHARLMTATQYSEIRKPLLDASTGQPLQQLYFKGVVHFTLDDLNYIAMPFHLGDEFTYVRDFSRFSLIERLSLIIQQALIVDNLHSAKPYRDPILHLDIKDENFILNLKTKELFLIDFGFAIFAKHKTKIEAVLGTPEHIAPEALLHIYDTPNDIYALAPLMSRILGCDNPYRIKEGYTAQKNFARVISSPFYMEDLLPSSIPLYDLTIKETVRKFLNRMTHSNPFKRPTSSEVLRFFVSFRNISFQQEFKEEYQDKSVIQSERCRMELLASGFWQLESLEHNQHNEIKESKNNTVIKQSTFDSFDLIGDEKTQEDKTALCIALLNLANANMLDPQFIDWIHAIINEPIIAKTIAQLKEIDSLKKYIQQPPPMHSQHYCVLFKNPLLVPSLPKTFTVLKVIPEAPKKKFGRGSDIF